jgi:hypothetical protein
MLGSVGMKQWDAFISHASEDKDIVLPLAEALRGAGLRVWLDQQVLRMGDSLREKIDEGLANSRYGIVVLSPSFLAKQWPKRELNGLMALEESGHKVILPVWHQIDRAALAAYSPILADRLASDTRRGMSSVAADIIQVIVHPDSGSPAVESPTLARRFIELLDGGLDTPSVRDFLSAHARITERAVGGVLVDSGVRVARLSLDLCLVRTEGTTMSRKWLIVQLASPSVRPFSGAEPTRDVTDRVDDLVALRRLIAKDPGLAQGSLQGLTQLFLVLFVGVLGALVPPDDFEFVRRYNDELFGITLRTYDWLVEAALD